MKNYKPVLKVLAKPEFIVAVYLRACCGLGCAVILYGAYHNYWLILFLPLYWYIYQRTWQRYYLLTGKNAVQSMQVDGEDNITIWCVNKTLEAELLDVEVVDKLLLGKTLLLHFRRIKPQPNMPEPEGRLDKFKSYLFIKKNKLIKDVVLFFSVKRLSLVVSEPTMGVHEFKELLRRLNR